MAYRKRITQEALKNIHLLKNSYQANYKCGICQDTGYVVKSMIIQEYDPATPVPIGIPCPKCKGKGGFSFTGFPEMYSEADMERFDFSIYRCSVEFLERLASSFWEAFPRWEENGKGLYLWSETKGSGKTFLACCLAGSVQTKYRKSVKFVSTVDYFQELKDAFHNGNEVPNSIYGYMNCDLLVLDDLGSEKISDWTNQELFRLIDHRMNRRKPVIVTSNMPFEQLKCDSRVADRLASICIPLQMPEISIRSRKARKENDEFIKKMFRTEEA